MTTAVSNIIEEMKAATKLKQKSKETRAQLVARMVRKLATVPDEEWDALTVETQAYVNDCIEAMNNEEILPLPADEDLSSIPLKEEPEHAQAEPEQKHTESKPGENAPAATPKPKVGRNRGSSQFPDDAVIIVLANGNPKRPHTKAYNKFSLFEDGMTVAEYRKLGMEKFPDYGKNWPLGELRYCVKHGLIKVGA